MATNRVGNYHPSEGDKTGDPSLDLVVAVVKLAADDAAHGDPAAAAWLWTFLGDQAAQLVAPDKMLQPELWAA